MRRCIWRFMAIFFAGYAASPSLAADVTGVTKDTIKIGMWGPLSGEQSLVAKTVYGAAALYKDINDRGGIYGRKFELVIEDDACDAKKEPGIVRKLLDEDKVFLLHGGWCSGAIMAAKPDIVKAKTVPYMILGAASDALSTPVEENIFHPVPTSRSIGAAIVEFALSKQGAKSIAIVTQSEEGPFSKIRVAQEKLKSLNITPVATVMLKKGLTDATEEAKALKAKSPDIILASLFPQELAVFLRDSYRERLRTSIVATESATIDDTYKRVGIRDVMKDLYFFYPFKSLLTSPGLIRYANIVKKYYPSENLDMATFQGMGGTLAIVEAIKRAGPNLTRERVLQELNGLKNFETPMMASPITFSNGDHAGVKSGNFIYLSGLQRRITSRYPGAADAGMH
jgi:branched-chain amino acid transport system substrate-binding protein